MSAEPEQRERRVTPLELFFDLVFVFAITQVSAFVAHHPTWHGLVQGLAIMAVLWQAWVCYAWFGNTSGSDDALVRVVMLAAMGAMLIVSLAVPGAFDKDALIFGLAYLVVRALHLGAYLVLSRREPHLRLVVVRLATTMAPAAGLIALAGAVPEPARGACWIAALLLDFGGLVLRGVQGWNVEPSHFAERHGAIIIIALGESVASLGVGAESLELGGEIVVAALLGITVASALWWAYFDVVALRAAQALREADHDEQVLIARDSYTYLHMPMVAGIVLFAVGVKLTLEDVEGHLPTVPALALAGGIALYLVALSALKRRNIGSWNRPRLCAAAVLLALIPMAGSIAAIVLLAIVAVIACGLIAYEMSHYAVARERIRHAET
jgi:low temperature requirement protein LtrA